MEAHIATSSSCLYRDWHSLVLQVLYHSQRDVQEETWKLKNPLLLLVLKIGCATDKSLVSSNTDKRQLLLFFSKITSFVLLSGAEENAGSAGGLYHAFVSKRA